MKSNRNAGFNAINRTEVRSLRRYVNNILHPVVSIALLLILIHTALVPAAAVQSMELKARFQKLLDSVRVRYELPGATAAYVLPDGRMETFATGFADLENSIRMNPQARMLAASIGKTFVGAVAVTLVEEGLLCLDDPVSTWIGDKPWFSRLANHDSITLRHLLTHHAGIKDHIHTKQFMRAFAKHKGAKQPFLPEDLIGFILDRPALFAAGEKWHYSDTGYILIGLIIKSVTQTPYYDLLTQRFLQPLQLDLTTFSNRRTLPGLVPGYTAADNAFGLPEKSTIHPGVMAWHPGIEWTGGGLVSNSGDLAVWAKALYSGDALSESARELLLQSVAVSSDTPDIRYGMGTAIHQKDPLGASYGHAGWIPGYCSSVRYYSDYDMAVAVQINTDVGIVDSNIPVMQEIETKLARIVKAYYNQ